MMNSIIQRILVVDDEEGFRRLMQGMLQQGASLLCDTSLGASEALDMLDRNKYELVISDIQMPGGDGIEFMQLAKAKYPELEFIIMTHYCPVNC